MAAAVADWIDTWILVGVASSLLPRIKRRQGAQ